MKKIKAFDCVEMKSEIQARLVREYAGLTDDQRRRRLTEELNTSDDPIARKWRCMRDRAGTARKMGIETEE